MASAADGYGGGADDQLLQHHHHQQQHHMIYHVPQQSRREKLRFPPEETSFPLLHHTNTLTTFLPSSSSSSASSSYYYYSQNPNYSCGPTTEFIGNNNPLHLPTQIPHQPFSLSLSSSSSTPPPPPPHQLSDRSVFDHPAQLVPFTGYAAVLNQSRFLEPARQLLEELCDFARGGAVLQYADSSEPLSVDHAIEGLDGCGGMMDIRMSGVEEQQLKKTRLISMLDEVYKRYKQYCQQVQAVIMSFESVAGLSTAAPYASMALKAMSKHFKCLKNAISDQLHHINKALEKAGCSKEEYSGFGLRNSGASPNRMANNMGTVRQPHVWRPQRGLPERAVAVLRAWLFEHFLHPYPTDTDKQMLAKQTGLSRNQVSNWFINARVRLWKPMVEEVHSLEMRQQHKVAAVDKNLITNKQTQLPSASTSTSSNNPPPQNTISQKNQNPSSKCSHNELTPIPNHIEEQYHFVYDKLSGHHDVGVGEGVDVRGNGVSLTLGLHENNGVCLAEPLPLNVRRFDLEECNDAFVMGAFEGQDRHFGKDIGGHLLHDFVG